MEAGDFAVESEFGVVGGHGHLLKRGDWGRAAGGFRCR
jgi:hypothetical protein